MALNTSNSWRWLLAACLGAVQARFLLAGDAEELIRQATASEVLKAAGR